MLIVATDEHLPVQAARAGEADAWDTLFKRYQLPLYTYVFPLVHDEQSSLDIVQETFINAVRNIHTLRQDEKFGSWLFSIAHQKCVQTWRKRDRADRYDLAQADAAEDWHPGPDDLFIRKEKEEEFMALLNQLPHPQRSAILLYFFEEFSLEEIAVITETQIGTVKSRIHYARKALRKLIEEQ